MPSLSLCMIVKNEEEVLDRCLSSVRDLVDEIVIVDTGSSDTTVEIALRFGARIVHHEWSDDFGEARNISFANATSDYILWLDADDVVLPEQLERLRSLKERMDRDIYYLQYDYSQDEEGNSLCLLYRERIVRNLPEIRWLYPIHECLSLPPEASFERIDIRITHRRTEEGAAADESRNLRILEKAILREEYHQDLRIRYYLAREYQDHGRWCDAIDSYRLFLASEEGWIEDRICARYRLAQCHLYLSRNEPEEADALRAMARIEAKRARSMDDRRAEPCYLLGSIALEESDIQEAIFWYELCLRPVPDVLSPLDLFSYTVGPLSQLCVCYDRLGDIAKAEEYNNRALALAPNDPSLTFNQRYLRERRRHAITLAEPIRLNLGSGNKRYGDYVNCDKFPGREVDWVIPLESIPLDDNMVTAIHSEHALEHTYHTTARAALREWFRVLKPGGELLLKLPDLEACCRNYLEATEPAYREWFRYTIYGIQRSQADEPMEGQIHYTGFSTAELVAELMDAGFVIDYAGNYDGYGTPSIVVRGVKPAGPLAIGWMASGIPLESPQYRIRVYHIDRWLRGRGYRSAIITPERIAEVDTVIFSRHYTWEEHALMRMARQSGKRVILDICEDLFELSFPAFIPMIAEADVVICCSHVLAEKAREFNRSVFVIEDAVESDFSLDCSYDRTARLRVAWMGMGGNVHHAEALRPMIEELDYELITIHEHPSADIPWAMDTWMQVLLTCDIAIAPIDPELQPAKSNNRLCNYMALGLPTIAAPLDAYTRIIRNGENGFIAHSPVEWRMALERLRDPEARRRIGRGGKESARGFDLDTIAGRWLELLLQGSIAQESVDIIIPACGDSPYLRACIASIWACTPAPYRIIVVMSGTSGDLTEMPPEVTVIRSERRLNYSEALNLGIAAGNGEYLCLMNDDVIVTNGWLEPLRAELRGNVGICNPLSNCDRGWLHDYDLEVEGIQLLPGSNTWYEGTIQMKGVESPGFPPERLYGYNPGAERVYRREWVAFYATLVTRDAIRRIGMLDEQFVNGCEDLDYCRRGARLGIECRISERSFVFHFGGVSRSAREALLQDAYRQEDRGNHQRVSIKYDRPLLVIHTGYAFERWTSASIDAEGIGGSETAAARMAEEFVTLGYHTLIFCHCDGLEGTYNGVTYVSADRFERFIAMHYIDVFIGSRYAEILEHRIRAGKRYFWVHDIYALGEKDLIRKHYDELDGIFCLSPWHAEFFAGYHQVPASKIIVTGNGVDPTRFARPVIKRQPARFIYASSPDRGLDTLLDLFPAIRAEHPEAELHVFYGFQNWDMSIGGEGNDASREWRDRIHAALDQPGVFYHGRVGQERLAEEFLKSDIWLYPTRFTETYCITALEAQMAGVLCICTDLAGLRTTVAERGILVEGDAYTVEYRIELLKRLDEVLRNRDLRNELAERGRRWARRQSWRSRARQWAALFETEGIEVDGFDEADREDSERSFLLAFD